MKSASQVPGERPPASQRANPVESIQGSLQLFALFAVVAGLYLAREVLAPLAMAFLLAFLLIPLVKRMERKLTRVGAVVLTLLGLLGLTLGGGWLITNQAIDLAQQLPKYHQNLSAKIHSMRPSESGKFEEVTRTLEALGRELSGNQNADAVTQVKVVEKPNVFELLPKLLGPLAGPMGTAGLVFLLTAFILMGLEDLQARLFRLVGNGRITMTSRAIDDASHRVRKYLLMQLIVNFTYGAVLALGLLALGIPNALLWGALACVLRFIPYVGPWIAAAFPILLSLAISPGWTLPMLTVGCFVVIELLSNNVMEPMLYGSSTGVSSFALIVAAVFWTWLWGPIGLVLATPLTVLLVVVGQYVPQLSFLSVMLSEEEALSPVDNVYLRLLRTGDQGEMGLIDEFLEEHSAVALFDQVMLPILRRVEIDHEEGRVNSEQRKSVRRELLEILRDADFREGEIGAEFQSMHAVEVWALPARAERDALAGSFVAGALQLQGFRTRSSASRAESLNFVRELEEEQAMPDVVVISVVAPTTLKQARSVARRLHEAAPKITLVVGIWGETTTPDQVAEFSEYGVEAVVGTVAEALAFCEGYAARLMEEFKQPELPEHEDERLAELVRLGLPGEGKSAELDQEMAELAKRMGFPMAFQSVIAADTQHLIGACGLPDSLEETRKTLRSHSLCAHVVADNEAYVIPDLQKDRRFAANPLVREFGLRFYAGVPVKAPNGQAVGSLCVMDVKPGRLTPRQKRLLEQAAKEIANRLGEVCQRTVFSFQEEEESAE